MTVPPGGADERIEKYRRATLGQMAEGLFVYPGTIPRAIFFTTRIHCGNRGGIQLRIKQNRTAKRPYRRVVAALLLAILIGMAGLTARAGKAQSCRFPLESSGWRVSDAYGWREDPFTGQKTFHRGIDLACGEGTPVLAVMDGVVSQARMSTSYGNVLCLCHENGQETVYAHLQYLFVRPGEVVGAGQIIGTVGQTGRATGVHLHFELWSHGNARDPAEVLDEKLLP